MIQHHDEVVQVSAFSFLKNIESFNTLRILTFTVTPALLFWDTVRVHNVLYTCCAVQCPYHFAETRMDAVTDLLPPQASDSLGTSPRSTSRPLRRGEWSWSKCCESQLQELQFLLMQYDTKKVLLQREGNYWVLPGTLIPNDSFQSSFEPIYVIPTVHEILGAVFPMALLRQVWRKEKQITVRDTVTAYEKTVILMECVEEVVSFEKQDYRWIPLQDADVFHLSQEAAATIHREIKMSLHGVQPLSRSSWQRPGWLFVTLSWTKELLLCKYNAYLSQDVIQLRSSHLGIILLAKTTAGQFFVKCTSHLANDAAYTRALARVAPAYVAAPVAVDVKKQIMITADYGKILNTFGMLQAERKRLTKDYVRLQMATIDKTEELIHAGFPDLRLARLFEHIDRLAACPKFASLGNSERSRADVEYFCKNAQLFKDRLGKMVDCNLPPTVTHNDLWATNAYKPTNTENYMFFDFVEAYISHPFASSAGGLDKECFLQEWSARSQLTMAELDKSFCVGQAFHRLAVLILRLREGSVAELPESEECFHDARSNLFAFLLYFRSG